MSRLEADCLALLAYVSKHRGENQTYRSLSEATGIPVMTLRRIVQWPQMDGKCGRHDRDGGGRRGYCRHPDHKLHWSLVTYGRYYGFGVRFIGHRGEILDVENYGLAHGRSGRLLIEESASKFPWTEAVLVGEDDE